jgi:hypothetical protein
MAAAPMALSRVRLFVFNIMGGSCKVFTYALQPNFLTVLIQYGTRKGPAQKGKP